MQGQDGLDEARDAGGRAPQLAEESPGLEGGDGPLDQGPDLRVGPVDGLLACGEILPTTLTRSRQTSRPSPTDLLLLHRVAQIAKARELAGGFRPLAGVAEGGDAVEEVGGRLDETTRRDVAAAWRRWFSTARARAAVSSAAASWAETAARRCRRGPGRQ